MKFTKMSLVAALLVGSSAFAIENTKVNGDANLFYQTQDGGTKDFFESGSSSADMSVNLNLTTDLLKTDSVAISAGVGYTVLTTLGLEGQMVDAVWGSAHQGTENVSWVNEAWFAATTANTTVKVGCMELDTPLAFTETWSIEKNTFESAVLINQDIPNTTLVAAYVGRGNGNDSNLTAADTNATGGIVNADAFTNFGGKGAYAIGAINNSIDGLTLQAWYYDIVATAQAAWLQADYAANNIIAGAQYTTLDDAVAANESTYAFAGVIGYNVKDTVTAKLAYSSVDTKGAAAFNTATGQATGQTKMYTEVWWNYGQVTKAGAQAIQLAVAAPVAGADLGLYITSIDQDGGTAANPSTDNDMIEYAVTASKSIGFVDATVAYIHTDTLKTGVAGGTNLAGSLDNMLQVYLTANF